VVWALPRGPIAVGAAAGLALVAACACAVIGSRVSLAYLAGLSFATMAVLLIPLSVRIDHAQRGELAQLARGHASVTARMVVSEDPHALSAHGVNGDSRVVVAATVTGLRVRGVDRDVGGQVLVFGPLDDWAGVLPGQRVVVDARLAPSSSGGLVAATLTVRGGPAFLGGPPWWQRAAGSVRSGLRDACHGLPALPRGLLPGLVVGDTSHLDPVLKERFRVAGLTHLVAVSGTNCSIVVGSAALVMRRLRASPRATATVGLFVLVAFVITARPSPSVLRAAAMAAIALYGIASGRQRDALPLLAASVIALLVWRPALAADLGFVLSSAATASLLLVAPGWADALRRRGIPPGLAEAVAVASAAHVVTAPIIVGLSGQVSLVAIPANLLAEPVVAAATVLGVLAAVSSPLSSQVAAGFAQLAGLPCRWLVAVAEFFGSLPGAAVPWPRGVIGGVVLAALTVLVAVSIRWARPRTLLAIAAVVAVAIQIPVRSVVPGWPVPGWLFVACDVGQGDALVLSTGGHGAVVIDAGPDPVAIDRCLTDLGVRSIALLVISHDHLDHVGGIAGLLHERSVAAAIVSPSSEPAFGSRMITNALAPLGIVPTMAQNGQTFEIGALRLDVLGPPRIARGTRSDPNNNSVVLMATTHGRRILLPGDAEVEEQDELLASGVDLHADVLKVPHHGSAWSDPAFLQASLASIAVVSVGVHNDYGHPSPLLLNAMNRLGVPLYRTDRDGDIAVVEDGGQLRPVVGRPAGGAGRR